MNDKARLTADKKQCPYCGSNNVTYLGYSALRNNLKIKGGDSREKTHDFKCEECKRIFYIGERYNPKRGTYERVHRR